MKKLSFLPVIAALGLVACANTGVVPVGDGSYMIGAQSGGWSGSTVKAELFKEANAHCAKEGKKMRLLSDQGQDATFMSYASAEIRFTCE